MSVQKIVVIGAGQMGSGIAQVCAMAGYDDEGTRFKTGAIR
ncbi:3-hydroxyacyl-CoA dehydrogenase NAD-binding domain-containing protein [Bacillus pacificus]